MLIYILKTGIIRLSQLSSPLSLFLQGIRHLLNLPLHHLNKLASNAAVAATQNHSKCTQNTLKFIGSQYKSFKGKHLDIQEAPEAQNVLWENLAISNWSKFFRFLISLAITILLWILSIIITNEALAIYSFNHFTAFVIIVVIKNEQVKLGNHVRPTADCTGFSATKAVIEFIHTIALISKKLYRKLQATICSVPLHKAISNVIAEKIFRE